MNGHCKTCGRREGLCGCPWPLSDTVAVVGIVCILLCFVVLGLWTNAKPERPFRHAYDRPLILGPDFIMEDEQDRIDDQAGDPDPIYDYDEEPT